MEGKLFIAGALLGMVGGALLVAHSVKARSMIKEGEKRFSKKPKIYAKTLKKRKTEKTKARKRNYRLKKKEAGNFARFLFCL